MNIFNTDINNLLDLIDENTLITSDTHFGHDNILNFEPLRNVAMEIDGFKGHENHNEWLVATWNKYIKPNDVVLHLGDFAFKGIDVQERLNGRKFLILGNHDRKGVQTYNSFELVLRGMWVHDGNTYLNSRSTDELFSCLVKKINRKQILFSHYPCTVKEFRKEPIDTRIRTLINIYNTYECTINVHGHTHSHSWEDEANMVNVCFDNTGFKPIRLKDILNLNP